MPVIQQGSPMPSWCELRTFSIVRLEPGSEVELDVSPAPRNILIVGRGDATVNGERHTTGEIVDIAATSIVVAGPEGATVVHLGGTWGEDFGGIGLFGVREVDQPHDNGDPVDYAKRTSFDAHFHDCDEYWIVIEGRGTAVSEGQAYEVGPNDCVATGMGHHHDFPAAQEPVHAVFFETTLQGEKRRGHLWEHTHGPAQPQTDRQ